MKEVSFEKYKKRVESIKYRDFSIAIGDIAKYPGQYFLEYKYKISCPNWPESGYYGTRVVFPAKPPRTKSVLQTFDLREQLSKKELKDWLIRVANQARYNKS